MGTTMYDITHTQSLFWLTARFDLVSPYVASKNNHLTIYKYKIKYS